MIRYYRSLFCVPLICPTVTTSPTNKVNTMPYYDISLYCRACRSCRVHCRKLKTVPVAHRHILVSYRSVPVSW